MMISFEDLKGKFLCWVRLFYSFALDFGFNDFPENIFRCFFYCILSILPFIVVYEVLTGGFFVSSGDLIKVLAVLLLLMFVQVEYKRWGYYKLHNGE